MGMGLFAWWSAVGQITITSSPPLTANNGSAAVTAQVSSTSSIFITGISNTFSVGTITAEVWYRPGGVLVPPATTPTVNTTNGWILAGTATGFSSASNTVPTAIPIPGLSIPVNPGTPVGICVVATSPASGGCRYVTYVSTNTSTFTNGGATLETGPGFGFGGTFPSPTIATRQFAGSITFIPAGPCTNPPFVGAAITSNATPCAGQNFTLSLDTATYGTGQTYKWERSSDNITWDTIPGANGASLNTSQTSPFYYRLKVTCGATATSAPVYVYTGPAVTPLFENFTGATGSSTNPAAPGCWSYWEPASHAGWGYTISSTLSKSAPNRWYFYNSSNITDYIYLVSPQILGLDSGTKQISFWQTSGTTSYSSSIVVGTVADPANPAATFSPIDTLTAGSAWTEFIVALDSANGYNGTHQFIAFAYKDGITLRAL